MRVQPNTHPNQSFYLCHYDLLRLCPNVKFSKLSELTAAAGQAIAPTVSTSLEEPHHVYRSGTG
ncbi:protein of unknown function [Candidatus Promineifilum breve]|uniref:Uncharacterized protein n=1 Tax=Candidatus Promineifilum breve TaxID=1806508 RepID=A0A160T9U9_9CHLR|nr:protein of unknown function [Candidatus Promineifilum breve]